MILLGTHAQIQCDQDGCTESTEGRLVLLANGAFCAKPPAAWQIGVSQQYGPQGPLLAFCPAHTRDTTPPRIVSPEEVFRGH